MGPKQEISAVKYVIHHLHDNEFNYEVVKMFVTIIKWNMGKKGIN